MVSNLGAVFVSYSRKDYYFAESLTFHLGRLGVPAWLDVKDLAPGRDWEQSLHHAIDACDVLLLVVSPAALASAHVRSEWQRALAAGRRLVLLGWHRRVRLPPELQGCEWLDFRGRFTPALRHLVALLGTAGRRAPAAGACPGWGPRLPPAAAGMVLALALPIVGYAWGVAPATHPGDLDIAGLHLWQPVKALVFAGFTAVLVWGLCLSLLQRRMGMTRLAACLAFVAAPFALSLWNLVRHGAPGLSAMNPLVAQAVLQHWRWALALAVLPAAALVVELLVRPEDLLRWMPTGKGWPAYRRRYVAAVRLPVPSPAQALRAVQRFHLLHDTDDGAMAGQLRAVLQAGGAREAPAGAADTTLLLLLSNRSRLSWLARAVPRQPAGELLTVVGTAIGLAPALDWLWRRQWLDLRRWQLGRPAQGQGLPALPEAVTAWRLPPPVLRLHLLLCALGTLLGQLAVLLAPPGPDGDQPWLGVVGVLGWAIAWQARQLLRRATSAQRLRRWLQPLLLAGVGLVLWMGLQPGSGPALQPGGLLGAGLAGALAVATLRALPGVAFWLPQDPLDPDGPADRLVPPADWRTLATVLGFIALWSLPARWLVPL